jgi:phosphoribosylformylglycinamidine cyclo-ligase
MGVGMMIIVSPDEVETALEVLKAAGEDAYVVGKIEDGEKGVELC